MSNVHTHLQDSMSELDGLIRHCRSTNMVQAMRLSGYVEDIRKLFVPIASAEVDTTQYDKDEGYTIDKHIVHSTPTVRITMVVETRDE